MRDFISSAFKVVAVFFHNPMVSLKGVGLYEILMLSQCINCSRQHLALSQFAEAEGSAGTEAELYIAGDGDSNAATKHILVT